MNSKEPLPYRPDIDGLRALAVIAVMVFHAFPSSMKGGFVGVDIFFVISGFLISGIILRGLESNDFSFAGFYGRRIRRIFPALALSDGDTVNSLCPHCSYPHGSYYSPHS